MIYIVTNAVPILLAGLAGAALMAGLWRTREGGTGLLIATLAGSLWLAAILAGALILAPVDAERWTVALGSAFIIWVGFVLPTLVATLRSRGVGWLAASSDAGAWLAAMLLQAAVLQLVGLIRP
jgi:hypothetical protein